MDCVTGGIGGGESMGDSSSRDDSMNSVEAQLPKRGVVSQRIQGESEWHDWGVCGGSWWAVLP